MLESNSSQQCNDPLPEADVMVDETNSQSAESTSFESSVSSETLTVC